MAFRPTFFSSTWFAAFQAQETYAQLVAFANTQLLGTGEARYNTSGSFPPVYQGADSACHIEVVFDTLDQTVRTVLDNRTEIFPMSWVDSAPPDEQFEPSLEGIEFVGAHQFGPQNPAVVLFGVVGYYDLDGDPVVLDAMVPEVQGANGIAGVIWISGDRLSVDPLKADVLLVHELGHLLTQLNHNHMDDWDEVLHIMSQPYGTYYVYNGFALVPYAYFDTQHLSPVWTTDMGSQCVSMRTNSNYLTNP